MKELAVLRHAKSSWGTELDDFNRPLNERGWRAARRMGRELKDRGVRFDLVVASPAARVRETIDGMRETYEFTSPIRFEQRVYLATTQALLLLIRDLPDAIEAPLLVGHNPGLERLLVELSHDDSRNLRRRVAERYPTAALAVLELPAAEWGEVSPGSGEIVELILPKERD